jgi:hypothetical protein
MILRGGRNRLVQVVSGNSTRSRLAATIRQLASILIAIGERALKMRLLVTILYQNAGACHAYAVEDHGREAKYRLVRPANTARRTVLGIRGTLRAIVAADAA